MYRPSNINKIHRHLGDFQVVDYTCFSGDDKLPDGNLELYYDRCDNKVYVCKNDKAIGRLKLNEQEQKFLSAILSSGMNLLECSRVPFEEKMPLEQKFRVSIWMKCFPCCRPKGIEVNFVKKADDIITSLNSKLKDVKNDKRGALSDIIKKELNGKPSKKSSVCLVSISIPKDNTENDCCSKEHFESLIYLVNECCDSKDDCRC